MSNRPLPITLLIHEQVSIDQNRTRKIRLTAESLSIGSHPGLDIELKNSDKHFLAEIKFSEGQWWIVNPLKSDLIRVNGKKVHLSHPIQSQDQILLDTHLLQLESDVVSIRPTPFSFAPHPGSDSKLWDYLCAQSEFDEILINGAHSIYVDFKGSLHKSPWTFSSHDFLSSQISKFGKKNSGWISWRGPDGQRLQAALPPVSLLPSLCIRRLRKEAFSFEEFLDSNFLSDTQAQILKEALVAKESILISGGTSTGKTSLLQTLVENISPDERLIVIEEEREISWKHPHLISIEAKEDGLEKCLRESLRLRPSRIILSEIRGAEAFEFIQMINTGHPGSLSTIHANSPREALLRIENLILARAINLNPIAIRSLIAQALKLIVQLGRAEDGRRFVESMARITGIQQGIVLLGDPVEFETPGIKQEPIK